MQRQFKTQRQYIKFIVLGGFLVLVALPFGLKAVQSPVNYLPKAYIETDTKTLDESVPNHPPVLENSTFAPIKCQADKDCNYTFKASDRDLYDSLELTIDFLPPNLKLSDCQTSQTLIGYKRISCQLSGIAQKPGNYKILATVTDSTNPPINKTFTLEVD